VSAVVQTKPPFRAEHVGSFMRPPQLLEARRQLNAGAITPAQLRAVEDECIREIVSMQERVGIPAVTDGEFRRNSWRDNFFTGDPGLNHGPYRGDRLAYFADIVPIYQQEIAELYAAGCRYRQIDEVPLAALCDPNNQQIVQAIPGVAALGMISTKLPALEPLDDVRRKVDEAAQFVPMERLALCPQCGFSSAPGVTLEAGGSGGAPRLPRTSADEQERKLAHVVELASRIWS
jgi:methionine synthase II (cobalamin-independent)